MKIIIFDKFFSFSTSQPLKHLHKNSVNDYFIIIENMIGITNIFICFQSLFSVMVLLLNGVGEHVYMIKFI